MAQEARERVSRETERQIMKKEIIINSTPHEIRIAILEDDELVELMMERADARRIVGNIYKGVVASVKPGLQAAFIDIGLEKAGFLHASDLVHEDPEDDEVDAPAPAPERRPEWRDRVFPDIGKTLKVGDEILVQVTKEQIGTKGSRLTADLSLAGRFLVLMPKGHRVGVSRKIEDRRERVRLKQLLQQVRPDEGAFIIRTAAEGITEEQFRKDVDYLTNLWQDVKRANAAQQGTGLVHEDVGMVVGLIRDIFKEDVDALVIDEREDYERLVKYVLTFAPELRPRVREYSASLPVFDHYGIEAEIRKSLDRRVWMKKGGYLVIEQTEALVSIDVNTGRFTGKRNQEDTILQTNLIAAHEAARQVRLRDLGGIIVIDFIDMDNEANKKRVLNELRTYLKNDRARTKTFGVSNLGLVEMSRQRVRPSLIAFLSDACPYCTGMGKVQSLETLSNRIERLIHRAVTITRERRLQIQANPTLALFILEERGDQYRDLARAHAVEIDVLDDPALHREDFRLLSLDTGRDLSAEAEKPAGVSAGSRGGDGGGGGGSGSGSGGGGGARPSGRPPLRSGGRGGGRGPARGGSRGAHRN
jgi:ribonuclease G